jgi:hypothetical protein
MQYGSLYNKVNDKKSDIIFYNHLSECLRQNYLEVLSLIHITISTFNLRLLTKLYTDAENIISICIAAALSYRKAL